MIRNIITFTDGQSVVSIVSTTVSKGHQYRTKLQRKTSTSEDGRRQGRHLQCVSFKSRVMQILPKPSILHALLHYVQRVRVRLSVRVHPQ